MSNLRCKICGRRALMQHTVHNIFGSKEYCSKECKKSDTWWKYFMYAGVLGLFAISVLPGSAFIGFILLVIVIILTIYSLYLRGSGWPIAQIVETNKFDSKEESRNREEETIFSVILNSEVRICCYQSARLNDKYCVCGRVLNYPLENSTAFSDH